MYIMQLKWRSKEKRRSLERWETEANKIHVIREQRGQLCKMEKEPDGGKRGRREE